MECRSGIRERDDSRTEWRHEHNDKVISAISTCPRTGVRPCRNVTRAFEPPHGTVETRRRCELWDPARRACCMCVYMTAGHPSLF